MKFIDSFVNLIGILAVIAIALMVGAYFGYAEAIDHAQNNYVMIPKP